MPNEQSTSIEALRIHHLRNNLRIAVPVLPGPDTFHYTFPALVPMHSNLSTIESR